jgi:dinuclear metal center YbgI/SA1388 family protein
MNINMAPLDSLIGFLDELLNPSAFEDHGPNGLQVTGPEEIGTVVTGVTASVELLERAAEAGADLVLVHHGLFWRGPPRALDRATKRRLQVLFEHDMALAAYHLPLDAHPEHGNNALLAAGLGARVTGAFEMGVAAEFDDVGAQELVDRVRTLTDREPLAVLGGPERVRRIAIVSGGGQGSFAGALEQGFDAFLTGEASERNFHEAHELGGHFIAAGHHATETLGVRRLGDLLADRFGVHHVPIDVPNPI